MILLFIRMWILVHSGVILFPHFYSNEIIVSFVPYSIIGHIILLIGCSGMAVWQYLHRKLWWGYMVGGCVLGLLLGRNYLSYTDTYDPTTMIPGPRSGNQTINFLYANMYYKNNNFPGLLTTIQQTNPDIILFVEYAKIHDDALKTILSTTYPYRNRSIGAKHFDGDVIYSRYPLHKIEHDIIPGSWSFTHVEVEQTLNPIDIVLVHTSAPVSNSFLIMRNQQMKKLSNILREYYAQNNNDKKDLIVLGDFNASPWSPDYKKFDKEMKELSLHDITTDLSRTSYKTLFPYTRCHQTVRIVCSHIDHVRSNNSNLSLERIDIPGSDHDGLVGKM